MDEPEFPRLAKCSRCGTIQHLCPGEEKDCPLCTIVGIAVAAERERCAKIAEGFEMEPFERHHGMATEIAAKIRSGE